MAAPSASGAYSSAHGNPPPPPLSMAGGPPQQGPSVLQILAMGQERNHAADAMAHHPRIESLIKLGKEAEATWLQIGQTAEAVGDFDRAVAAYEAALRHNAYSVVALSQIAAICRSKEEFKKAAEYFGRVVGIAPESGDVWGALGHCYLMIDDLKKAYSSYQQALYYMPNPHEPKLWYGIGILYDRYGSLEHAEEAFSSVIRMDPNFEKANEIFFRLGIIYKQQRKSAQSLECFRYILNNPPRPLTEIDIWFQIGHVYEQQKDFIAAKESYERVLQENPAHAKVLQQLGGLYHRSRAPFYNPEVSVQILTKSLESDPNDPFSWYLLGRAYMTTSNFGKAYEAYQQAVYRDGKNPAFWCSIGVLYYNINQFHDALDAYSRAIRIHPYLAEVWFNLGALYEACNDQMTDAIDAYQRTLQLDPSNTAVSRRLREIREHQASGSALSAPPPPKDISPSSMSWNYATNSGGAPTQLAHAGLGPDMSPPLPPQPGSAAGPPSSQSRVPTATGSGSPLVSAGGTHRFDGRPGSGGSRPRSTDPYRRASGGGHEQSPRPIAAGSPAAHPQTAHSAQHRLPQMKDVRGVSPPSPRTRPGESAASGPAHIHAQHPPPASSYPFPSHLAGGPPAALPPPRGGENGSLPHDAAAAMEWERTARAVGGRASNGRPLAPPAHAHAPLAPPPRSPPVSLTAGPLAGPGRAPFFDNPPPGPYGGYPPAQHPAAHTQSQAQTEEHARRRSSGSSTAASHRSGATTEAKPQIADASSTSTSTAAPAKGKGSRAKKEPTAEGDAPKKGGRKSKAATGEDGAASPKKPRKSKAAQEKDAAAKAAAVLNGVAGGAKKSSASSLVQAPTGSPPTAATPAPTVAAAAPPPPSALPQRDVDEEYDEGVDALMSLGGTSAPKSATPGPTSASSSNSATSPSVSAPAPAPEAEPTPTVTSAPKPVAPAPVEEAPVNPRKRSLPAEEPAATPEPGVSAASAGASSAASPSGDSREPEAKRSRSEAPPAVPSAPAEEVEKTEKGDGQTEEVAAKEATPAPSTPSAPAAAEAPAPAGPESEPSKAEVTDKVTTPPAVAEATAGAEEREEGEVVAPVSA